ncbi:hypothetical protein OBBRIDRAFT_835375 [Obba rivulosa]|uniref:Zn(2)-C6 fungal-type domain-containing protein n=1 Tax=Obba rivulosa TaxID=1052685 RepID=A0A8E2B2E6_9APHY|nr:hypothetical protein OBBRIDRAFT_835375 [Obba rivulosa]
MSHHHPRHPEQGVAHSALQMEHHHQPPPPESPHSGAPATSAKKRRKADDGGQGAEPRRLRRSHEACARCRSKKIKCDSKHPRCTACALAGTQCQQEDRHRNTLTPRGHTERLEHQLLICEVLIRRFMPDFALAQLDEIEVRENIVLDADPHHVAETFQFIPAPPHGPPGPAGYPQHMQPPPAPGVSSPSGYPPPPPTPPMMPSPYGMYYPHPGMPYPPHMPPGYGHPMPPPPFQHPLHPPPSAQLPQRPPSPHEIPGQDPRAFDIANPQSLAKSFEVSPAITENVRMSLVDKEDLAVGLNGLTSKRDNISDPDVPQDPSKWISVHMRRNSISVAPPQSAPAHPAIQPASQDTIAVWLPKDRAMVRKIVDVYFTRLNLHRPVFNREDFDQTLSALYSGEILPHDPGFVCSIYLVLALGTLSELNHRVTNLEKGGGQVPTSPSMLTSLLKHPDWPHHEEFFQRALIGKPELRVTVSSLQALILLHWYLYTERPGRTLWRMVGSLVRLAIELGLHHDPTSQSDVFSEKESRLRIHLWSIVLLHDRGTSILLGRPLAIAPSDSNTPRPKRSSKLSDISEHFELSAPIDEIQADIINSLYAPTLQTAGAILRHADRITKSLEEFRRNLPERYKWYFGGTEDWPVERRQELIEGITEDIGLTLLKIGITRILLLRAMFSAKELTEKQRQCALADAVLVAHNIIVIHNQLIRFPDIAFFVSPIPLHISAMVILYAHISKCYRLDQQVALEDVWMALDMLPSFRWRWERKDLNGGHPMIEKLAEIIFHANLHQVAPTSVPLLLSEQDWMNDGNNNSHSNNSQMSPRGGRGSAQSMTTAGSYSSPPTPYGTHPSSGRSTNMTASPATPADNKLVDVPPSFFYPGYPETVCLAANAVAVAAAQGNGAHPNFHELLAAAAAAQPMGTLGYQPSQETYMMEEKDIGTGSSAMQLWNGRIANQHSVVRQA